MQPRQADGGGEPVTPDDRGPSRVWYWVGGAVALVGVSGAVLWFVLGLLSFSHEIKGFQRVPADGEPKQVTLLRTGSYTAYYEPRIGSVAESAPPIEADLVGPDGRPVPLSPYDGDLTYDMGGHHGRAVFTFRVDDPGTYELRASSPVAGELALGRGVGKRLVTSIVGGFVIGFVTIVVAAPIVIVTAVRRSSARRRRQAPPRYPPPS